MKCQKKTPAASPRRLTDALVGRALNEAAQDAVELHRRAGLPLVVWQEGKVALVPADEVAPQRPTPVRRSSPKSKPRRRKPPGKASKK